MKHILPGSLVQSDDPESGRGLGSAHGTWVFHDVENDVMINSTPAIHLAIEPPPHVTGEPYSEVNSKVATAPKSK